MSLPSVIAKWSFLSLLLYAAAWTLSYVGVFSARGDSVSFDYYFAYLALGWSFSGGELPTFMWLLSIVVFLVLLAGVLVSNRVRRQRQKYA